MLYLCRLCNVKSFLVGENFMGEQEIRGKRLTKTLSYPAANMREVLDNWISVLMPHENATCLHVQYMKMLSHALKHFSSL